MTDRSRATLLLMRVVPSWDTAPGTVAYWDRVTSGNDARTALSITCGAPLDSINPASGNSDPADWAINVVCICKHNLVDHHTPPPHACRAFLCRCARFQTEAEQLATGPQSAQPSLFDVAESLGGAA